MDGLFLKYFFIFVCVSFINCSAIPLILWSKSESLIHQFSDDVVGNVEKVSSTFTKPGYDGNVVVFIKDEMTYEDFAHYGDVYNLNGNGGVLRNIMKYTESHPSRHFTLDRDGFVEKISGGAWTAVHRLNADQLSEEELHSKLSSVAQSIVTSSRHLILVHLGSLANVQQKDTARDLAAADHIVELAMQSLTTGSNALPLTAVFVGSNNLVMAQKKQADNNAAADNDGTLYFGKRHLLAVEPAHEGIFVNVSGDLFLYFKSLEVNQYNYTTKKPVPIFRAVISNISADAVSTNGSSIGGNSTSQLVLEFRQDPIVSLKIRVSFNSSSNGDWSVSDVTLVKLECTSNCTTMLNNDFGTPTWLQAPSGYSYHCSGAPTLSTDVVNVTVASVTNLVKLTLNFNELQLQPFHISHDQFGPPNECIGLFTVPIWSGLIVTLLLILILAYGLGMVSSITTMDRFDDPRSKPLLVNTGGDM